ncbi:FAD-binding-3 domain-containing protein [Mycena venus]|uniref:FAD-binding-3 domain-containing protein n=1 Tax=Mycena venus TaxID=2733690 RepID=A0A8H7CTP4_9AGAR|nr:FAD-binding-3 domain-containing protein [Mycena venus]
MLVSDQTAFIHDPHRLVGFLFKVKALHGIPKTIPSSDGLPAAISFPQQKQLHRFPMNDLTVLIVGAGIGGLQTALALAADGHTVTVLESVKEFLEVGAGIRVPPNSSRLSLSWGVDLNSVPKEISRGNRFVDWHGNTLLDCPFDDVEDHYGAPYYFIHRADLIDALVSAVRRHPKITLRMNTPVASYDFSTPAVTTGAGERLTADLIICADGIKSAVRSAINGRPLDPVDTGDVAYRILVPTAPLLADPEMRHLVENAWAVHWMGPEGHAVGYPLRGGRLYNVIIDVTHHTDLGMPIGMDEWRSEADNAHLVGRFKDWCPEVRRLCALTGTYLKWKLADFKELDRWVHPAGRVALLGDACHPMMPYMAQGAAQATEDAAALAAALRAYGDIPTALAAYEAQRKPRAAYVAHNTRVLQEWLHLYDGPEQQRRDELMKHNNSQNPIYWACPERKDWLFGHDATILGHEPIPAPPPMPRAEASVYKAQTRL